MGLFTKASVRALRRDVEDFTSDYIAPDRDVVSTLLTAAKGRERLADLFALHETAAADVGEEEALDAAVDAALSEIDARFTELRSGDPRETQDLAERILRAFLLVARHDGSALTHFRDALALAKRNDDEASVRGFYSGLARQRVLACAGDPRGERAVNDMSTAREMFREKYDRVVDQRGQEVADWATIDHARTTAIMSAAIYDVADPDEVVPRAIDLVRSLLATD